MRSVLTVLGITIGIAAVICVVAIGKAGQARVEQQLNNLGDSLVWVEAGGRAVNGVRTGTHGTKSLTYGDAVAIKNKVSLIKSFSPNGDGPIQVIYGNQVWYFRNRPLKAPARRPQRFCATGITSAPKRRMTSTFAIPRTLSRRSWKPAARSPFF